MNFIAAFLIGNIAYFGFAPTNLWIAPIISLYFLKRILKNGKTSTRLLIAQLFGAGLLLPNQIWTGTYVGNLPWIILVFIQSFLFWPFAIRIKKNCHLNSLLFASNAVVVELLLRTVPFTGFGWSRLSFTQTEGPLVRIFPLFGCAGVAFLMAFIAANRKISAMLLVTLIISLSYLYNGNILPEKQMKLALVQGGVKNLGLDFNATPREVFERHLQRTLSDIRPNQVDLIIWPENSVDVDLFKYQDIKEAISGASRKLGTPILVGGITNSSGSLRNISVLFEPDPSQVYTKRYLTPFGEYIPIRKFVEKFSKLTNDVEDFSAGVQSNQIILKDGSTQIFICYELLNDSFKNEVNSDFLTVQTNNATFGDTAQLDQEQQIAQVRAIETGRDVAYVSTTGITSFIDRNGRIKFELPKFQSMVLFDTVDIYKDKQLNQKLSNLPEIISVFMVFFILIWSRRSS